jgi:uncharacterized protein YllA (UPF0747 family)
MNIGTHISDEIETQLEEKNLSLELMKFIVERIENDEYLWEQIRDAIDYAIEQEVRFNKKVREKKL